MHTHTDSINTQTNVATQFLHSQNVSRKNYFSIAQGVTRVLSAIDTPAAVKTGSREHHQAEAMKAAEKVRHQFTAQAKKNAKRECLGHLIASLARPDAGQKADK
ncbi:hypothetical protein AB2M95_02575 [Pseudomonas chlororaphis]|uniref:hypothetical protein n=1 Tax=Pseudomonas chlororaphis TaxID=587753 RepID=UPI0034622E27